MQLLVLSFVIGAAGAGLMARFGLQLGLSDDPGLRSSHHTSTPRGGGIGFFLVVIVAGVLVDMPTLLILSGVLVALLSFLDDRIGLSPKPRLFFQFLCAGMALWAIAPVLGSQTLTLLWTPVFLIFIVGTANFYNFMDGINGIAGITGLIAFGLAALFGQYQGEGNLALFAACLSLACLGFLPFNIPRARVFMGDVGSVLLGFLFAGLVLLLASDLGSLLTMMAFLLPFYVDELTTMAMRLRSKENLFQAHRRHFYQFLANECSIPHWHISLGYGVVQLLLGFLAIGVNQVGLVFVVIFCLGTFLLLAVVRYVVQSFMEKKLLREN